MIKVRFAPSPTGYLHIGSARTALFNWLFAKNQKGHFYLRIEDTDFERSTKENIDAIFNAMKWLGLDFEGEPVIQSQRIKRHQEVVAELLEKGLAYKCYCTKEALDALRLKAEANKEAFKYPGTCRNNTTNLDQPYVVRLKAPQEGLITIHDGVQGDVTVKNAVLDDLILLRSDGSPTYMLSVVVDDHDMGITHIIRGDDHLTNTFKQYQIYTALGWSVPKFFHIPLIHSQGGGKMSKRHGAVGVETFKEMGILPDAMFNYLLRLGWSHGDEEIISRERAIEIFSTEAFGKSPARFDLDKLLFLNAHYMRQTPNETLVDMIDFGKPLTAEQRKYVVKGLDSLKQRAKTLLELKDGAMVYIDRPEAYVEFAVNENVKNHMANYIAELSAVSDFTEEHLMNFTKTYATDMGFKMVEIAQPLRVALSGKTVSPSVFEIMEILGKEESLGRIKAYLAKECISY